jgi:hypothetical protein
MNALSPSPVPLLDTALALAVQLLIARHPDLLLPDDVPRIRAPPGLRRARAIVTLVNLLLGELAYYDALEQAVDARPPARVRDSVLDPADDIPF